MSGEGKKKKEYPLNFNIIHGQNLILIKDYFFFDICGPGQQTVQGRGKRVCVGGGGLTAEALGSMSISPPQYINIRPQPNPGDLKSRCPTSTDSSHLAR